MPKKALVTVALTPDEAKALVRLAKPSIKLIRADQQPVSNEITLNRALGNVERGVEKIEAAMAAVESPAP
ncbi:hypothetical protein WCLP8_3110004 [uncultured Gammaproteobacteria bacterium]